MIGSGWRARYYIRIAKALPQHFELCCLLCRTAEKADSLKMEYGIKTTLNEQDIINEKPDFIVVAVNKASVADVSIEWLEKGYHVLAETPCALDKETIDELLKYEGKLVIAEQYLKYPENIARVKLLEKGLIGKPDYLYLSLAHEYHGASLMRKFLDTGFEAFKVTAWEKSYPTVETLSRYERFEDGRISNKSRTLALFEFESGKSCLYDFDSEQYRSPIRNNHYKLQGVRGEMYDDEVSWIDQDNVIHHDKLDIVTRTVLTDNRNPNLNNFEEVREISMNGEKLYEPPFGLCGLSQDETAMAMMLEEMREFIDSGKQPYSLKDSMYDACMAITLRETVSKKETIVSNWKY
ncbi:MAG: Gfo/Idh/MocA family oxidoreductase [Erysipelotrichaceae bacterium]|nr:Gfo/Idh/MocA family oxidoreductase [Erysipelotrichaceae bacterium]